MGKLRILAVRQWEGCNYPYLLYCLWYLQKEVRRISENGYMKFMAGYAPNVTGEKLYSALNAMG